MAKPSTLTRMLRRLRPLLLLVLFALSAPASGSLGPNTPSASGSAAADKGLWSQADAMVNRLREERRKLRLIFEELERLQYMGQDFRDLQLYPTRVTRLEPEDDVRLDRMIDALEKNLARTRKQVVELEKPLDDAYFIAKEMLQETPNQDMVELLLKDNVERIGRLVLVQKELNKRWDDAFALLAEYRARIGLAKPGRDGGLIEDDFFKVLMANVGRASQRFYGELNDYKDSLAARTDKQEWEKMANLDLARIKARLASKSIEMVQEDLARLSDRFQGRISIGKIDFYLGSSFMVGGKPLKAADAFARVASDSRIYGPACLGVLQALFDSRQDDSLLSRYKAFMAAGAFDEKLFPPARFLAVQSAYELGQDSIVEREMMAGGNKNAHYFKSLFVYAKSLVRQKRFPEARGVLVNLVSESQIDKRLHNQAELALAHLNFEEGHYEQALKGYQNLLDQQGFQAEALYGMVWANIRMGDLDAGEFILKKLIAQYPDNPWAIEGFNVLVRKVMLKARNEWAFRLQVDKETDQLKAFDRKLRDREDGKQMSGEQLAAVKAKLEKAAAALARQKPLSPEAIARLYQQGLGLCDFVEDRYKSGEYSEQTFNKERETVLAKLVDPAHLNEKAADSAAADSIGFRMQIKRKLFESRALALDIHVLHKTWLEELLKYTQRNLNLELAALRSDTTKAAQRAELSRRSRMLADDISERLAGKADDILRRIRELSEDPNSSGIMDWLLFQKGYLNYGLEEDALRKRMASFQWLEAQAGAGPPPGQSEPTLDPQSFEAPWKELIEKFPDSPWRPAALYYMGYTQTLRGETVSGLGYFEELARKFPRALYAQQALIFIGEYYFNENKLEKAAEAYDKVLDYADSKYFEQALYKLAWTRYRANAYKTAISSFTFILEESARKDKSQQSKSALTSEALQFAALSIAESDTSGDGGLKQSKAFADKLGDARLGAKLLHRMAVIYTQAGRMDRSKQALEALMNGYKDYEKMPEALLELGRAYEKEQDYNRAAEVREKIFRLYCRGSDWYKKINSAEAKANADSVNQQAIEMVARHYLYEAKQLAAATGEGARTRETYFRKAISAYEAFLSIYPENPNRAKYNYQEAEAYYSLNEFGPAARKYMQVSKIGDAKLRKTAAYNAIVAAQEMLKKTEDEKK
ncbi:MAG TPA: tetratricopeptide repeat protein [Fibrobacteria bacterium]|nr:tetratricopeptide repeat protein [Fibrobacteria bacterium]